MWIWEYFPIQIVLRREKLGEGHHSRLKGQFVSTIRMVTVSSNNTVEKDMKTKHVKKQIPETEKSASSDT